MGAPTSWWASCTIFVELWPRSFSIRELLPLMADSSARTRSALGETTRWTRATRASDSSARSMWRAKIVPLAPVMASVRFFPPGFSSEDSACGRILLIIAQYLSGFNATFGDRLRHPAAAL